MERMLLFEQFIQEKEDKFADYPAAASKNAKKAIEWKEKYGRDEVQGGTEVGWQRAHQLAKGEAVSRDVLGRMAAFNRHRKNSKISAEHKDTPWKDNGHVAWLIWGGDEGVDWAIKKMEELDESVIYEGKAEGDRGPIDNKDIEKALKSKADDTGVPIGLLRIVMRRGMDAWNSGHRPGTNQTQWGYARVNAFLEKGDGTWQKADKDVAKEVRDGGHDKKLPKKY
tara:strand:+ start:274 stop:948 length:675 start_codon:yes stop_codon:yes gene_type:complete